MFPMQSTRPDHAPSLVTRERPLNTIMSKVKFSSVCLRYKYIHAVDSR